MVRAFGSGSIRFWAVLSGGRLAREDINTPQWISLSVTSMFDRCRFLMSPSMELKEDPVLYAPTPNLRAVKARLCDDVLFVLGFQRTNSD